MKLRDSGMPEEAYWESLLQPAADLDRLGLDHVSGDAAEFGGGYGTFTLPLSQRVDGIVWTYDIEPSLVRRIQARAEAEGRANIIVEPRDLFEDGTGLPDGSVCAVAIFNLLHGEAPARILAEALRILEPQGVLAVMHWIWSAKTPRGPALTIRPKPNDLRMWCESLGFRCATSREIDLPPYHYGWRFIKG